MCTSAGVWREDPSLQWLICKHAEEITEHGNKGGLSESAAATDSRELQLGQFLYLDTVVGQLIAGGQHLSLFLFHSPLFEGIGMYVQKLGYAWML